MKKPKEPVVKFVNEGKVSKGSDDSEIKTTESEISNLSFKRWHKQMQIEHEILTRTGKTSPFQMWKCCDKCCIPCRWFDSIDYDKKISKCCLKFKTFKNIITIILIALFFYALMYAFVEKEVLPGGSVFYLFILFLTAYLMGYIFTILGLPPMIGHLIAGIIFGNIPWKWLPEIQHEFMESACKIAEKIAVILVLIRAGLLLDFSRLKNRLRFVFLVAVIPFVAEFLLVCIASHYLLNLEWTWSALQGSTINIVSVATITSIMEKNKKIGYGEDKHLSTVLIAAAVINATSGIFAYFTCLKFVHYATIMDDYKLIYWKVTLAMLKETFIGTTLGIISGLMVSFFPDKRNSEAAGLRIIVLGIGSFGLASCLNRLEMTTAGTLACLIMCFLCTNMWEELGWHQDTNPVLYFYTMAYYIAQPMVLSLLGYTMELKGSTGKDIGLSVIVLVIGLAGKESFCFLVLQEKSYPTTFREKIFICIAWMSKGTFQALLAFSALPIIEQENKHLSQSVLDELKINSICIRRTTILAILFITPLVCYALTLLTPKLLTKIEDTSEIKRGPNDSSHRRKSRVSISPYQDMPSRKISVKYFSDSSLPHPSISDKDFKGLPEKAPQNKSSLERIKSKESKKPQK